MGARPSAAVANHGISFDHLLGSDEQRGRDRQTECLGGFEIDDQAELIRLLYGHIGWLRAL